MAAPEGLCDGLQGSIVANLLQSLGSRLVAERVPFLTRPVFPQQLIAINDRIWDLDWFRQMLDGI